MRRLATVLLLIAATSLAQSPERSGFTITSTLIDATLHPEQHAATIDARLSIRNDGSTSLRNIFLQISSSSKWQSVAREQGAQRLNMNAASDAVMRAWDAEKPQSAPLDLAFTEHRVRTDADHTGEANEARIDLDQPMPVHATITLDVKYDITVEHESERLTKAGAPADVALATDWDRIATFFAAVRGVNYVLWYPVSLPPATLDQGNAIFTAVETWRGREAQSGFFVRVHEGAREQTTAYSPLGMNVPVLIAPTAPKAEGDGVEAFAPNAADAQRFALTSTTSAFAAAWLPPRILPIRIIELPEAGDLPYTSANELFVPPNISQRGLQSLALYPYTQATLRSSRAWIEEGYAAFLDDAYREQSTGRASALEALDDKMGALSLSEPEKIDATASSVIDSQEEVRYRTKAQFVWWMLKDMLGDGAVQQAIKGYRAEDDRGPSYMQRLLEAASKQDLTWFFDDWVYRDRGIPEFSITATKVNANANGGFATEITIANSGGAGAIVPVSVKAGDEEVSARVKVAANAKASVTIATKHPPRSARVNDGSVPETDMNDNEVELKETH